MAVADLITPFSVTSPEDLDAARAKGWFVDVFTDFPMVRSRGHSLINGPRGCGKSMMFRFMQPDCQMLSLSCGPSQLPFFAVLVSVKNFAPNLTELSRIHERPANLVVNEHLLTMMVCSRLFAELAKLPPVSMDPHFSAARELVLELVRRMKTAGWSGDDSWLPSCETAPRLFSEVTAFFDRCYVEVTYWLKRQSRGFRRDLPYTGALCGFADFLRPVLDKCRKLPFMPASQALYLLIDDADWLNIAQTRALNSWIAARSVDTASIKASTQLRYRTFQTLSGDRIEKPHDYNEVNIVDLYTTKGKRYLDRVREIVLKRLKEADVEATPESFFPPDESQEAEIRSIGEELRKQWAVSGRGHRPRDDALRYARPTYMTRLRGSRKAGSKYSYSGFEQLVHLSSGIIRFFLEPAAKMYLTEASKPDATISHIPPSTQDKVVREEADSLMMDELDASFHDAVQAGLSSASHPEVQDKLRNLVSGLGGAFQSRLLSDDASERRVFSVAITDTPEKELQELLQLGVQFGYFHRSMIGNKEGTGRVPLYVLTRRLAPHFGLDPTGFAGYLFMKSDELALAVRDPASFVRRIQARAKSHVASSEQLTIFS